MKIRIRTFASLKEICGFSEKDFIVSEGLTVSDLFRELCRNYKGFEKKQESLLFAVNDEYCGKEAVLSDNDVLAIFPPVSGG